MPVPTATPEQRAQALAKAAEARKARSALLASLSSGELTLPDVLGRAGTDPVVAKTKVSMVLRALPGIGQKRAAALMEEVGIDVTRRVGGLTDRQRERLVERVGAHH